MYQNRSARQDKRKKTRDELVVQMPIPATTDSSKIKTELEKDTDIKVNFFFSTYQSIDVVKKVQDDCGLCFDIAICDEARWI